MLALLLGLVIAVAIAHLPPVQRKITRGVTNYLSSKIASRVDIQAIDFSILGDVTIHGLTVWDPDDNRILSAQKIAVRSNIVDLVMGNLIFDDLHIDGVNGQLIQSGEELNIQFIIDAFKTTDQQVTTTEPVPIKLQVKRVLLENIVFEFTSELNGTSVAANVGKFASEGAQFSTNPNKIKADQITLQHSVVNTLVTHHPDTLTDSVTSESNDPLSPDFGTGIVFEIKDLSLQDDAFSFHRDHVTDTRKFDPFHISLKNIQIELSDILIREDTLAAGLQSISAQLPGFNLTNSRADMHLNRNRLFLSGVNVTTGTSELQADLTAPLNMKAARSGDQDHASIAARCRITPGDVAYFFSDSVIGYFAQWDPAELRLEGNYASGQGEIKVLNLKTGNSQVDATGMVHNIFDLNTVSWKDMVVNASIGSSFRRTLTSFVPNDYLPPDVTFLLKSSGTLKKIYAEGQAFTAWGDLKATGLVTQLAHDLDIDVSLRGERINLEKLTKQSWLGHARFSADAKGIIGDDTSVEMNGLINSIQIQNETMHNIAFQTSLIKDEATIDISVKDPNYRSEIKSEISLSSSLMFTNHIRFDDFRLGSLLRTDTTLLISGATKSKIIIGDSSIEGYIEGDSILFENQYMEYLLDSLALNALVSPALSDINYFADNSEANIVSNFDLRDLPDVIRAWSKRILKDSAGIAPTRARVASLDVNLDNANLFKVLDIAIDDFSSLKITVELDEQKQTTVLQATTGEFKGYGISMDTLRTTLIALRDSIGANVIATNLYYDSVQLGNLDFAMLTNGDTTLADLLLSNDSITILGMQAHILSTDSGAFFYPDKLRAFDNDYFVDPENPIYIENKNLVLNHFLITRDLMQIDLHGDLNAFDVSLSNIDLTPLNYLISQDTALISKGRLAGKISYSRNRHLNLQANIDGLSIYNSNPLTISATAVSDDNEVPFQFLLTNTTNSIDLRGTYFLDRANVDATLLLDINNPELFEFLVSRVVDEMRGTIKGKASITGPVQKPGLEGSFRFVDLELTTVNPKLTFNVEDDSITLNNSSLILRDFTIYDTEHHPLTINGTLSSEDYESFAYDVQINSDEYALINNPDSTSGKLRGTLVIKSDIKLQGNEKDTNVEAKLTVKEATNLSVVTSDDDIELLNAEGIVDFIDPALLLDSAAHDQSGNYYDSLIASLPDFNLNSTITIEENAVLRVIINEQSGDYIEASGGANLELDYDRTGNLHLSGDYNIKKGVYRLSFYDLVKKNFALAQGSSISWSGSPENGNLNIKAEHTVESNSLGLIGHEIGENEKSIYKRSLDYVVGININGTIEKPIISFSLDLPQNDKVSYPVLASKLDRLRQPEYESELNKQVFGLLVLGGFLPETSGSDINSNVIATTALSNSVNSLLASQLNRFASQYVKGVSIDVGIQSYSDYSAPGGKTQTAMDFRVTKSIMDDRLSFEIGGDFDINQDQSGANTGSKNYRGDIAIIYDLTGNGDKQLKLFNNETYDIVYQEIRNTGVSLIFIRESDRKAKKKNLIETARQDK